MCKQAVNSNGMLEQRRIVFKREKVRASAMLYLRRKLKC